MPHGTFCLGLACVVREAGGWGFEGFLEVGFDGFFRACLEIYWCSYWFYWWCAWGLRAASCLNLGMLGSCSYSGSGFIFLVVEVAWGFLEADFSLVGIALSYYDEEFVRPGTRD